MNHDFQDNLLMRLDSRVSDVNERLASIDARLSQIETVEARRAGLWGGIVSVVVSLVVTALGQVIGRK